MLRCLARGESPDIYPVELVMTRNPVLARPYEAAESIAERFRHFRVRRLPVVQNEEVVGIISASDLARSLPDASAVAILARSLSTKPRLAA